MKKIIDRMKQFVIDKRYVKLILDKDEVIKIIKYYEEKEKNNAKNI